MSSTRRTFLRQSALAGAGVWLARRDAHAKPTPPNEKLNIGVIGVASRGRDNLMEVRSENIVALCDVDDDRLAGAAKEFPSAARYHDFRRMLDRNDLDAVVVSTADHTHAVATVAALNAGLHVYCEKPLTHTVAEARAVAETARKRKRVTQMGTQIHAGENYRRVVELVKTGAIGTVREVHVWLGGGMSGGDRPKETPPVPASLQYDLWLGPAEYRPYHPEYVPYNWRKWWAFGNGTLGDFGCHFMDLPFWALDLRHPTTVAAEGPPVHPETTPAWLVVRYAFPARGTQPPVAMTWYHGGRRPDTATEGALKEWGNGILFVGSKGMLAADYGRRMLLPEKEFAGFTPPEPFIPNSVGHHREWIEACKTGGPTTCNFDYAGALTEAVLLGNVAYRAGETLNWDARRLRATNSTAADRYLRRAYRRGWRL